MPAVDDHSWVRLTGVSPELLALAGRCLRADGGLPMADDPAFLRGRWEAPGGVAFGLAASGLAASDLPAAGRLVAAGVARPTANGASFTGLVDPAARGRGLGAALLDRGVAEAAALAGEAAVLIESETLTAGADALFTARGFRQIFAEDVMRFDLTSGLPEMALSKIPDNVRFEEWSDATARRFHAVYEAAFRDRPGFPDDPPDEWIADNEDDEDFRPQWSLLAADLGPALRDLGFLTAAQDWIVQVGVIPAARGRGLATALISEALHRMAADGATGAWLTVNVNNPGAAALYRRLGFAGRGRRGRYKR